MENSELVFSGLIFRGRKLDAGAAGEDIRGHGALSIGLCSSKSSIHAKSLSLAVASGSAWAWQVAAMRASPSDILR